MCCLQSFKRMPSFVTSFEDIIVKSFDCCSSYEQIFFLELWIFFIYCL